MVLTDISSLLQNEAEPDDGQSLIRLMLYSNEVDIEGSLPLLIWAIGSGFAWS